MWCWLTEDDCELGRPCIKLSWNSSKRRLGASGAGTRVSENRCECGELKNLSCGRHQKRIVWDVGRYADDVIRYNFTNHPSSSVSTKSADLLTVISGESVTRIFGDSLYIWDLRFSRRKDLCHLHWTWRRQFLPKPCRQMRDATSQSAVFFAIFETCLHCKRCSKTAEIGNGLRFSVAC